MQSIYCYDERQTGFRRQTATSSSKPNFWPRFTPSTFTKHRRLRQRDVNEEAIRASDKNNTVVDLLRHLPYLKGECCDRPFVAHETQTVDYTMQSITNGE